MPHVSKLLLICSSLLHSHRSFTHMGRARWWVLLAAALCFSQHRRGHIQVASGQQEGAVNHHELHDSHERWKLLPPVFAGGTAIRMKRLLFFFFWGGNFSPNSCSYFTSYVQDYSKSPQIYIYSIDQKLPWGQP